jgi:hypothetical protein
VSYPGRRAGIGVPRSPTGRLIAGTPIQIGREVGAAYGAVTYLTPEDSLEELLTADDVAGLLSVSRKRVYDLAPSVSQATTDRFHLSDSAFRGFGSTTSR